jgi:hypothetical protein
MGEGSAMTGISVKRRTSVIEDIQYLGCSLGSANADRQYIFTKLYRCFC